MKKHIFLGAALLSLFAASCSNEDIINNDSETLEGQTISLQANIAGGSGTRMTYVDDATKKVLNFSWSDSESFNLYKGTGSTPSVFSKSDNGNIFTGTIPGGGSDTYYAVYGNNITNNNGVLDVNIANQTGVASAENGITTFMLAQAKYLTQASGMTPTLNFQHKLGVMKLTITFPKGVTGTANKVTINGLHNKATYDLSKSTDAYTYADDGKGDITATNGETGFTIDAENKITAYVAVFPENVSDSQVTIKAYVGNNEYYYTITTAARNLEKGKVVPVNVTLTKRNFKSAYTKEDYFCWDAYTYFSNGSNTFSEGNYGYHTGADVTAEHSCASCPTAEEMKMYLGAGVYWDNGTDGANRQTYTAETSLGYTRTLHAGLWVMKKAYIDGFSAGTANKVEDTRKSSSSSYFHIGRPTDINKYFFLPAAGFYNYNDGKCRGAGECGSYWSNSSYGEVKAYYLYFSNYEYANVSINGNRDNGCLPMSAE